MAAPSMVVESGSTRQESETNHHSPFLPAGEASQPILPNLPQEIIVEILARLPVRSLLRFRSVCKSWLDLISNAQFVKTHLGLASRRDNYARHRLVFYSSRPRFSLKSSSLTSILSGVADNAVDLDYPLKQESRDCPVWFLGSCNGLVCIASLENALFLWNPSNMKSKILPNSGPIFCSDPFLYGVGYDESNEDYKVVATFAVQIQIGRCSYKADVKVYSLRTDSWRQIGYLPRGIASHGSGKFVTGSLHWAARVDTVGDACSDPGPSSTWAIISLDLAKETYGEVVQPNYGDGCFKLTLGVLKEFLCMLCYFPGTHFDVWVMEEYGMKESWTKLFTISCLENLWSHCYPPLCISQNGEILLLSGPELIQCNPKDGTFRKNPVLHNECRDVVTYVESLVSPNVDNVVQRQQQ